MQTGFRARIVKVTIIEAGQVPAGLRDRFAPYPQMFATMFAMAGADFAFETVAPAKAAPLPDPARLEAILITGSSAGVYDDLAWLEPLRQFIRDAYRVGTPMLGICFGHQIMADALGGTVRKSEKGWGLGRHTYTVRTRPPFLHDAPPALRIACSHQDQVVVPPAEAEVILTSAFTPNAGLLYGSGAALSFQPHPEFEEDYARALIELRRGLAPDEVLDTARRSLETPSDRALLARAGARFLSAFA